MNTESQQTTYIQKKLWVLCCLQKKNSHGINNEKLLRVVGS